MPKADYTSSTGGALKLKGAKPTGIDKQKRKKKAVKPNAPDATDAPHKQQGRATGAGSGADEGGDGDEVRESRDDELERAREEQLEKLETVQKTEAERRHEEMRRKRLDERLKREGIKTHKERVEELNKYLSNLSEHHDMPRIGPG